MQRLREFVLRMAAILTKSVMLVPIFAFFCALYDRKPGSAPAYVTVWGLGLVMAAILYFLRARLEDAREDGRSGGIWKLLILPGAAIPAAAALYLLQNEPAMLLCGMAGLAVFGFWGWRSVCMLTVNVLSHGMQLLALIFNILCLIIVAIISFFNHEPMPLPFGVMIASLAMMALLSILTTAFAQMDYMVFYLHLPENQSVKTVRRFNRWLAVLATTAALLIGLLGFRPLTTVVTGTLNFVGSAAVSLLDYSVNKPKPGELSEMQKQGKTPPALAIAMSDEEEQETRQGLVDFIPVIVVILLLLAFFRSPLGNLLDWLGDAVRERRGKTRLETAQDYYSEVIEDVDGSQARALFAKAAGIDPLVRALRKYGRLTDPEAKVRQALPLLKRLGERIRLPAQEGDTARQSVLRFGQLLPEDSLVSFADSYDRIRYGGGQVTSSDGEAAAKLVQTCAGLREEEEPAGS